MSLIGRIASATADFVNFATPVASDRSCRDDN
jgi:hypothetical protein